MGKMVEGQTESGRVGKKVVGESENIVGGQNFEKSGSGRNLFPLHVFKGNNPKS